MTWETSRQTDIGFDMMLAGNRLGIVFRLVSEKTSLVGSKECAGNMGYTHGTWVNGGDIVNKGVETGTGIGMTTSVIQVYVAANMGYNKNEVVGLPRPINI